MLFIYVTVTTLAVCEEVSQQVPLFMYQIETSQIFTCVLQKPKMLPSQSIHCPTNSSALCCQKSFHNVSGGGKGKQCHKDSAPTGNLPSSPTATAAVFSSERLSNSPKIKQPLAVEAGIRACSVWSSLCASSSSVCQNSGGAGQAVKERGHWGRGCAVGYRLGSHDCPVGKPPRTRWGKDRGRALGSAYITNAIPVRGPQLRSQTLSLPCSVFL